MLLYIAGESFDRSVTTPAVAQTDVSASNLFRFDELNTTLILHVEEPGRQWCILVDGSTLVVRYTFADPIQGFGSCTLAAGRTDLGPGREDAPWTWQF